MRATTRTSSLLCWLAPLALALGLGTAGARAADPLAGMTLEQQVGQVFMVGTPATGVAAATTSALRDRHVGSVILTGRSTAGIAATAAVTASLRQLDSTGAGLLIAADQEGGQVQVLRGPGFSDIPSALSQGGQDPTTLRTSATTWGRQLRAAGVDTDLAPVLDTVPSAAAAATNPPIGVFDREYGFTPQTVAAHGVAFAQGMAEAGVSATAKHFPGLGRVTGNTDTQSGVTDTVTTRTDPYLAPFRQAVQAGIPMLMVSTAVYSRIDAAHPAAFSGTVIQGMIRGDLGFHGVVISDDLGSAKQVAAWSPGDRALQFLQAGGDLVLTVDPAQLPAMYDAVLARAQSDTAFRSRVQQAASRVVALRFGRDVSPVGVAAVGTSAGSVLAFVRGTDGEVWETTAVGGVFGAFTPIPSHTVSGPAAASSDGRRVDLVVVGTDRALWHASTTVDAQGRPGAFSWESLGGTLTTAPAIASTGGGRLLVAARGTDGAVWTRAFDGSSWAAWQTAGGIANSAAALDVVGAGTYRLTVVGLDVGVWTRQISSAGVPGTGWSPSGTSSTLAPAATATGTPAGTTGALALSDGVGIRQVRGNGTTVALGGVVTSAPAMVERADGSVWTLARGTDQALWLDVVPASGTGGVWSKVGGTLD